MASKFYEQLSHEGQVLVDQAVDHLSPRYDPELGAIAGRWGGKQFVNDRGSMYYALGLMLQGKPGCVEEVEKIVREVCSHQVDAPGEIFHGAFHTPGRPPLVHGAFDYSRLTPYARYFSDCFYEKMADSLRLKLEDDPETAPYAARIEKMMNQSVLDIMPLVWTAYDPNVREFLMMCFAMLLEHYSDQLSQECIDLLDNTCKLALEGAIARSSSNFTPLNTNIQCMHVFLVDYFGVRHNRPDYCEYALQYARKMVQKYQRYHSAAEFNSPTYCGVDLSTLGFWKRYASNDELKELGKILEDGIWMDMMEFYNPAMETFCGPFSRSYELDMKIHTCFPAMFYWALGEEKYPTHPISAETGGDLLMVFGGINMPEEAKAAVFAPKEDVVFSRTFPELSERGDPANNEALCTTTSWITPDLMTGAMAGSENPSHQLHPLAVFWRGKDAIGTIKMLRSYPSGEMQHMHTVFFNGAADRERLTMDVDFAVNRDVRVYYEIEYPGIAQSAKITDTLWQLPGLNVHMDAKAPALYLEKGKTDDILRVCYLSETRKPETKKMHFDMKVELVPEA